MHAPIQMHIVHAIQILVNDWLQKAHAHFEKGIKVSGNLKLTVILLLVNMRVTTIVSSVFNISRILKNKIVFLVSVLCSEFLLCKQMLLLLQSRSLVLSAKQSLALTNSSTFAPVKLLTLWKTEKLL